MEHPVAIMAYSAMEQLQSTHCLLDNYFGNDYGLGALLASRGREQSH